MTFARFRQLLRLPLRRRYSLRPQGGQWVEKGLAGRLECVLARPLYRFARFDLAAVAAADRAGALQLQLAQWSPFADSDYCLVWQRDAALVWAWDADEVRAAQLAQGMNPDRVHVLPETLLHPVRADGVWLVACQDGCEGQIWQAGHLIHSRWWPARPDAMAWINFQRDASQAPGRQNATPPQPLAALWQPRPWARPTGLVRAGTQTRPQLIILMGLCVLAALSLWYGMAYYRAGQDLQANQARVEALQLQVAPILEARAQALDAKAGIEAIRSLAPYPDPLTLMAAATLAFPTGAYLKEWEQRAGQVKFLFIATVQPSAAAFIKDLLATGWFRNAQANPGAIPNSLAVSVDAMPLAEVDLARARKWESGEAITPGASPQSSTSKSPPPTSRPIPPARH